MRTSREGVCEWELIIEREAPATSKSGSNEGPRTTYRVLKPLPDGELATFQDKVDLNLNRHVGSNLDGQRRTGG